MEGCEGPRKKYLINTMTVGVCVSPAVNDFDDCLNLLDLPPFHTKNKSNTQLGWCKVQTTVVPCLAKFRNATNTLANKQNQPKKNKLTKKPQSNRGNKVGGGGEGETGKGKRIRAHISQISEMTQVILFKSFLLKKPTIKQKTEQFRLE
jgi:hypothetical protein